MGASCRRWPVKRPSRTTMSSVRPPTPLLTTSPFDHPLLGPRSFLAATDLNATPLTASCACRVGSTHVFRTPPCTYTFHVRSAFVLRPFFVRDAPSVPERARRVCFPRTE